MTNRKLTAAVLAGITMLAMSGIAAAEMVTVAITKIVEHPALDAAENGIVAVLEENGYKLGENLTIISESAQGNPATAAQIARKFVGENPQVIVAIATPSAQAVVSQTSDIPVVFTAVTDPVGAKIIPTMEADGGNVTGLSDLSPIAQHMDLIQEIVPGAKTIGVPYNPGEQNAVTLVDLFKAEAAGRGLRVVTAAAPKSSDVLAAARSLVGKVDVIYVPTDNTIVTALESVVKVGMENKIPVIAGDTDSVGRGAIAAVGFNYGDIGRQTGEIVVQILQGVAPGSIPARVAKGTDLFVNPGAASRMGITLPAGLAARATKIVE